MPTNSDDGGSKDLWNFGKLLPDYTALQPRRQPSSYSPPWEPQILLCPLVLSGGNEPEMRSPLRTSQVKRYEKTSFSLSICCFPDMLREPNVCLLNSSCPLRVLPVPEPPIQYSLPSRPSPFFRLPGFCFGRRVLPEVRGPVVVI
jgi:hypothetical protein